MIRALAALLLLVPAAVSGGERSATLRVSAQVRRAVAVSIEGAPRAPIVVVRTDGGTWAGPLETARASTAGAVRAEPSAGHPGHVVVTVLADLRN